MSDEVLKFLQHISNNQEDKARLDAQVAESSSVADVCKFAADLGFVFEAKDFNAALAQIGQEDRELSDKELENASGGIDYINKMLWDRWKAQAGR